LICGTRIARLIGNAIFRMALLLTAILY
jgi:hypothetical protein